MRRRSGLRLTSLSSCAGCAAKLRPDLLSQLLRGIPRRRVPQALVGFETNDDAAVYQLSERLAVVETVDFFPPVLDDPFAYGQVAAANAMSDIWAMGAKALFALNLVCFPKDLPVSVLKAILAGGASKADEAEIPILGGHSIQSSEPTYGMAVTGVVDPKHVLTNAGAKVGDVLLLTKPLGTGIATTAIKKGVASAELIRRVTRQMARLNLAAGQVFSSRRFPVHALTDVTGFGLLGHGLEMAKAAGVRVVLELERIPILEGVPQLAQEGVIPGGTRTNLAYVRGLSRFPKELPDAIRHVLADAQTNGGLLAAVPGKSVNRAVKALERAGVEAWVVGSIARGAPGVDVV